jgi:hypothetical protein
VTGVTQSGVTEPAARLYDVRYSRFNGERQGRVSSVLALARSSATRALGLRRTTGSKVWPFLLIGAAHLPAVAAIGVPLLFDEAPPPLTLVSYSSMLAIITPIVVAFAATTLPSCSPASGGQGPQPLLLHSCVRRGSTSPARCSTAPG